MVKAKKKKKVVKAQKLSIRKYPFTLIITLVALLLSLFVFINELQKNQEQRSRAQIPNCEVAQEDFAFDAEEQLMFRLINEYRHENGIAPLSSSESLRRMASWMSKDMATKNYLDHTDSLGRDPYQRAAQCGTAYGAENIGNGSQSAEAILNQWKNSPSHTTNILDPKYKATGIARSGQYWTQTFATEDRIHITPQAPNFLTPTSTVPNPECLGSCPTMPPAASPTSATSTTITPTQSAQPTVFPTQATTNPEPTEAQEEPETTAAPTIGVGSPNPGGGNGGGIIELFLALLRMILEFLASLFK
jgi:uncharacterized protein YkwD